MKTPHSTQASQVSSARVWLCLVFVLLNAGCMAALDMLTLGQSALGWGGGGGTRSLNTCEKEKGK